MCGILAWRAAPGGGTDLSVFQRALTLMRHRGPDDEGYLLWGREGAEVRAAAGEDTEPRLGLPPLSTVTGRSWDAALGFRRLSILDLSPAGHQPMSSADGRYWIVYNGEVYNYLELRRELEALGFAFRTGTDTEVILAAFAAWGSRMLPRLVGMFAMCILDRSTGRLFLARDPFGIKPLYFWTGAEGFACASEIKPILLLRGRRPAANPARLFQYLRYGSTDYGDETLFLGVRQLPPATWIEVDPDGSRPLEPVSYWRIDPSRRRGISFPEAAAALAEMLTRSVTLHLRSDVPVGSCLSGGLDSSAIVALARRSLPPCARIRTFSYIADDSSVSEEPYVDLVNALTGSEGMKTRVSVADLAADLPRLVSVQEEPFPTTSVYAGFRVFRLAHENGLKVLLDGQGSDEIFGGYDNLIGTRITQSLLRGRLPSALRVLRGLSSNPNSNPLRTAAFAVARTLPRVAMPVAAYLGGEPMVPPWLDVRWFRDRGVRPEQRPHGRGRDAFREELLQSLVRTSLPQLLRFEDRNSMCFSIESRVPYCVAEMAEFAFSLPDEYLISEHGRGKYVLRESMRDVLPEEVLRRPKIGFTVPERVLAREGRAWIEAKLGSAREHAIPVLRHEALVRSYRRWEGRATPSLGHLWRCINLAAWTDAFDVSY